jgi:mRNA-degrading endonuclease toxin of MazEF toxin-antitoxin module
MPTQHLLYKRGDLYWCDPDPKLVDTLGSEQKGDRVWLIVSIEQLSRGKCVVGLPLSRHIEKSGPPHLITIPASEITMIDGNLAIDRVALTDQIRCLDKTRLRKKAGFVTSRALLSALTGLDRLLGRQYPSPKAN